MADAPVNHRVLVWARGERGLSAHEAAKLLQITPTELQAIEAGTRPLTLTALRRMATKYQIPLHSLLMPEPPAEARPRLPDFRTIAGDPAAFDQKLLVAIDTIQEQIEQLADLKESHPSLFERPPLPHYAISGDPIAAARKERLRFGVPIRDQRQWPTDAEAFRRWRAMIERMGVIVHILPLGAKNKCCGFSVIDERDIPVMVVNGSDTKAPTRSFSLFHELYHLLTRQSGISDENRVNNVERRCNQFAAYFLMPEDEFVPIARARENEGWTDRVLREIGQEFKTSMSAVAIHLEDVGLTQPGFADSKFKEWGGRTSKPWGPPMQWAEKQVNKLGVRHISVVLDALDRGYLSEIDAYEMTNVHPKYFGSLRTEIEQRQTAYGGVR